MGGFVDKLNCSDFVVGLIRQDMHGVSTSTVLRYRYSGVKMISNLNPAWGFFLPHPALTQNGARDSQEPNHKSGVLPY